MPFIQKVTRPNHFGEGRHYVELWSYMTVGELIEELKQYPSDTPIIQDYDSSWGPIGKPSLVTTGYPIESTVGIPAVWINANEGPSYVQCLYGQDAKAAMRDKP